jgi:hypothetical protein
MLLKIPNRSDQVFCVDLSRLLDDFVRLLWCIPLASWLGAPLGFRFVGLIFIPLSWTSPGATAMNTRRRIRHPL